jgi:RNase P subunit RPR2
MNLSQVNSSVPEDKKEFDELYKLLLTLSKKKFQPSNESEDKNKKEYVNSTHNISEEDHTLKDIFKTKRYSCKGCDKAFIAESLLNDHLERSKSCKKWLELSEENQQIILQKPIHLFIDECLSQSITSESSSSNKFECKFCNSSFVNKGNLHKHFTTSISCNRLSYHEFKQKFLSI